MKLSNYVTSTEDNVYAIKNIPAEVVGTVFAKVSRSPGSFRDNLYDLLKKGVLCLPDTDMISMYKESLAHTEGMMKKWGMAYGHASIKEHAFAQFCIEGVSRWCIEILETVQAAKWLSFTEFSFHYHKPEGFVIPVELDKHSELKERYIAFGQQCLKKYEELVPLFFEIIKAKSPEMKEDVAERLAYENARTVLPLATKSNVAVTGNARAISDAIAEMLAHEGFSREIVEVAEKIRMHATEVLPSSIGHTEAMLYQRSCVGEFYRRRAEAREARPVYNGPFIAISDASPVSECIRAEDRVLGDLSAMTRLSELPGIMRAYGKHIAVTCSEGCHHQIIRHRAFDFSLQLPDTRYGLMLPQEVAEASGTQTAERILDILLTMHNESHCLYNELADTDLNGIAPYVVLHANARRLPFYANMYGLAHFVTLHKEEQAQKEIRTVASQLERVFQETEQFLAGFKMDRHLKK
ncbi:FAD-dependent thymidylate synthase [Aneurinibacillus sp. UBA3580]|uniref:FAD-dependent thymidylate synthase n=1 Tax=Aneurinibacillus sp. UBA3580 TaxID=1946041 RepID=UPI00257FE944|nr:FAD-dependent thymidylate synthase [Aneurinibacillus sp. UBA3580]